MSEETGKRIEVLWTPQQVADFLNMNVKSVYRWIKAKKVIDPAKVIRFSGQIRIPRSEIERIAGVTRGEMLEEAGLSTNEEIKQ